MQPENTLHSIIAQNGPLTVADYMALCLGHPQHGYYNTRDPLGAKGDFITAPEITQVFGELVGIWIAHMWQMMGRPRHFDLIELGPGRGTLMSDAMRAASKLPGFRETATVRLVEMSPPLKALQAEAMERAGIAARWYRSIADIAPKPCIIIANEFFDALPFHQFVMTENGWRERLVSLEADRLVWAVGAAAPPPSAIPEALGKAEPRAVFERSPAREGVAAEIAHRLRQNPGAALIIDYGFSGPAAGDTFQALAAHKFADPLDAPGSADLTSHVDFSALAAAATGAGARAYGPITQAELLDGLGIGIRVDALKSARPDKAADLDLACARLVSPDQMGALFKALALSSVGTPPPFSAD